MNREQFYEIMSGEGTLFAGVKSLLPGHKLIYKGIRNGLKGRRISEYWNVLDNIKEIEPASAVDQLDAAGLRPHARRHVQKLGRAGLRVRHGGDRHDHDYDLAVLLRRAPPVA